MENRSDNLSKLMKRQADEVAALNNRYEAMKKSLNERYSRELSQIKVKHRAQKTSLQKNIVARESVRADSQTKH